jgi:hypothetical protein
MVSDHLLVPDNAAKMIQQAEELFDLQIGRFLCRFAGMLGLKTFAVP